MKISRRYLFPILFLLLLGALVYSGTLSSARAQSSYIIVDNETGYILASRDANKKRQIASLTKVATAMVTLDWSDLSKGRLDEVVTISESDIPSSGINPVGLQPGDEISVRNLLYCALMVSDNAAATALGRHVGRQLPNTKGLPPIKNFVSQMNALAHALQMKRTLFLNPHGLDNYEGPLPYSTPADLARLVRYAYKKSSFTFFVSQKSRVIQLYRNGLPTSLTLRNTNELLGQEEIDGVKTGRTTRAGDCLILSADLPPEVQRNGNQISVTPKRIIVVLLNSSSRFPEGLSLMRRGWSLYSDWASAGRKFSPRQTL